MKNQSETDSSRRPLRSIGAVLAGLLVIFITSMGTDAVLHATGVYPPWFQPMADKLWWLALAYRIVYGVAGGYLTARLAPGRSLSHALALGVVGLVLSIVGVAANWNAGPEFGPKWFAIALVITAIPCAWIGGKLYQPAGND
ncbi:MAG: hypothetical protein ACREEM_29945 [Blastocatellia bacterium]